MAGLISSNMNTTNPLSTVSGYDPEKINIEGKDTVQGQVKNIIDQNSPLMTQAATRAKQSANKKGLINSSMAVGAGQAALYDAALPIAQQDAGTNFSAKKYNQDAGNTASQFNAGEINRAGSQFLAGNQNLEAIGAQGTQQRLNIGASSQADLASIGAQGDQQRLNIGAQGDVESRLTQERGEIEKQLQTADAATRERLLTRQGELDRQLQELRGSQELGTIAAQGEQQRLGIGAQTEGQSRLQSEGHQQGLDTLGAQTEAQSRLQAESAQFESNLQNLRGEQATELATIENQYRLLFQTSQSAADTMAATNNAIGAILANPDMETTTKDQLIRRQLDLLHGTLSVLGEIGGLELTDLLYFGPGSPLPNRSSINPPNFIPTITRVNGEFVLDPETTNYTDANGNSWSWQTHADQGLPSSQNSHLNGRWVRN